MNWKQMMEERLTLFVLGILATGFAAGWAVKAEFVNLKSNSSSEKVATLEKDLAKKDLSISFLSTQVADQAKEIDATTKKFRECERGESDYQVRIKTLEKSLSEKGDIPTAQKTQDERQISNLKKQLGDKDAEATLQKNQYDIQMKKNEKIIFDLRNEVKGAFEGITGLKKDLEDCRSKSTPDVLELYGVSPHRRKALTRSMPRAQQEGFTFETLSFKRSGTNIYLEIRVTNDLNFERKLTISGAGREVEATGIYDAQGVQYPASHVRFGNQSGRDQAENKVPPGVPIVAVITFANVPQIGTQATVRVGCVHNFYSTILLRSIPLSE